MMATCHITSFTFLNFIGNEVYCTHISHLVCEPVGGKIHPSVHRSHSRNVSFSANVRSMEAEEDIKTATILWMVETGVWRRSSNRIKRRDTEITGVGHEFEASVSTAVDHASRRRNSGAICPKDRAIRGGSKGDVLLDSCWPYCRSL